MPHYPPDKLPRTPSEILATGTIDPSFAEAFEKAPIPPGSDYTIEVLKCMVGASRKHYQTKLAASRPSHITESEHHIPTRDGWESRTIICHGAHPDPAKPYPLIVLFFGGGHCVGFPEAELAFARILASEHNAVVVLPEYRLAPDFPFPYSVNDSWDVLQHIASAAQNPETSNLLSDCTDARSGFIVGGISAGANIASVLTHLARDGNLEPPLTGQALFAGAFIDTNNVPVRFKDVYLARDQNKHAPILDEDLVKIFRTAHKPDMSSPLWGSFDQHDPRDGDGEVKMGHRGLPPTYFQVCGMDVSRDDSLVFERVLREECGVKTKVDGYWGFPHCWWNVWPDLETSKIREKEGVDGVGWLLRVGRNKTVS